MRDLQARVRGAVAFRVAFCALLTVWLTSCGDPTGPVSGAVDADVQAIDQDTQAPGADVADTPDIATLEVDAGPDEVGDDATDAVDAVDAPDTVDVADAGDADAADVLDVADAPDIAPDAPDADVAVAPDADAQTDAETPDVPDSMTDQDADAAIDTPDAVTQETDAAVLDVDADDAGTDAVDDVPAGTDAVAVCDPAACPTPTEPCTVAICKPDGKCGLALAADGTPCDDGDPCTNDTCLTGSCNGAPITCNDGNACTTDSCDSATGCSFKPNTKTCSDDNVCTVGDACSSGTCVPGPVKACDDGEVCTDNSCDAVLGCVFTPNAATCTDGDACTTPDLCAGGSCTPGSAISCDDGVVCTTDSCNKVSGCQHLPALAACDDGNACTQGDTCADGACSSGAAVSCNDSNPCTDDSCDPVKGCVHANNTGACDDKNKCTIGDVCASGTCQPGGSTNCDDKNPCTTDGCSNGCYHLPASGACDDGDPCTAGEYCQGGTCANGSSYTCDDGIACTTDACDGSGGCTHKGNDGVCNDNNVCTADSCQNGIGCKNFPAAGPCDDGNPCTTGETCGSGTCQAGTVKTCDDGNPCTTDACNPVDGSCKGTAGNNGTVCDDLNACTVSDVCGSGVCAGTTKVCSDGNVCTNDGCNNTTGCTFTNNSATCPDADKCTSGSHCNGSGSCVAGSTTNCDDSNVCTADSCNGTTGACVHAPLSSGACDDGNACTTGETCLSGVCSAPLAVSTVGTVAGSGSAALVNGAPSSAAFNAPTAVLRLPDGSFAVADHNNCVIRRIAKDGTVSTLAGSGAVGAADGPVATATFNYPMQMALDYAGALYVADQVNHRIRVIANGVVTTLAGSTAGFQDGIGSNAKFNQPTGIAFDTKGMLWVADEFNHRIRQVSPAGSVTTIAGTGVQGWLDGAGAQAKLNYPCVLLANPDGGMTFSDQGNSLVRAVSADGTVTTLAGTGTSGYKDGAALQAQFSAVWGLARAGSTIVMADYTNYRIRGLAGGTVSTLAGSGTGSFLDGAPSSAQFYQPTGMALDTDGTIWLADKANHRIRKLSLTNPICDDANPCTSDSCASGTCTFTKLPATTACSDGNACTSADACTAGGVCVGTMMNCDDGNPCTTDACNPNTLACEHVAMANGAACDDGNVCTQNDRCDGGVCASILAKQSTIAGGTSQNYADGKGTAASFNYARSLTFDSDGSALVIDSNNNRVRRVTSDGTVTTVAGSGSAGYLDGAASSAQFSSPSSIAPNGSGGFIIADQSNHRIRQLSGGTVSTLAGSGTAGYQDGAGASAKFNQPVHAVLVGGVIYVADYYNYRIRTVAADGTVGTLAGSGSSTLLDGPVAAAGFAGPSCVAPTTDGGLWVVDYAANAIRRVANGVVVTVAGKPGNTGTADGTGSQATFNHPFGCTSDAMGNLYVADIWSARLRKVTPAGVVTTIDGVASPVGTGSAAPSLDGWSDAAKLSYPFFPAFAPDGSIWLADFYAVRKITLPAVDCDDHNDCTTDACDTKTGTCSHVTTADGTACAVNGTCGKCTAGTCAENLLAGSDEFNSTTLGSQWSFVNPDPANWSLSAVPGDLQLNTAGGSVWTTVNTAKNIVLQAVPSGSFDIITHLDFNPTKNYQTAGILLWQDMDNFVWLNRGYCGPCTPWQSMIGLSVEKAASASSPATALYTVSSMYLKLSVSAGLATGYYSVDGKIWILLGTVTAPTSFAYIGALAQDETGGTVIPAKYDFFHVSKGCYP